MTSSRSVALALQGLGLGLGVLTVAEFGLLLARETIEAAFLVGVFTSLPFIAAIVYVGRTLEGRALSPARYPRILAWCVGGLVAFVLMNLVIMVSISPDSTIMLIGWLRWAASLGGGLGLIIGVFETRGIDRAARAERVTAHVEAERARRKLLDDLNDLLRHEVLNASQVIDGYAEKLHTEYDLDEDADADVAIIQQRASELTTTIEDIRRLIDVTRAETTEDTADLAAILRREIDAVRERRDVSVDADLEAVEVRGGTVIAQLIADLLAQVATTDGTDPATVRVTVRMTPDTATVTIAGDGEIVTSSDRDALFVPPDDDSLAPEVHFSLVEGLAEHFGTTIERVDDQESTTTVQVEIPRTDALPNGPAP